MIFYFIAQGTSKNIASYLGQISQRLNSNKDLIIHCDQY